MSFINYSQKEINFKIVYYGPALSGKTTCLKFMHEKGDGKDISKISIQTGNERTLFFDFVPLFLSKVNGFKTRFHLYTVPGQPLYDDSRKLILKGVDGILFVVDSALDQAEANLKALENLKVNLFDQGLDLEKVPVVFQYNKRDLPNKVNFKALSTLMNEQKAPEVQSVATTGEGVFEGFKELAKLILKEHASKEKLKA